MAAEVVLLTALIFVSLGNANNRLLDLECAPANGEFGKTTKISCSFRSPSVNQDINIDTLSIFKMGQENPVFSFLNETETGDSRFKLPSVNNPSLELANTTISDEGEYDYHVLTSHGMVNDRSFRISVTAKYHEPTTISWPEKIEDGGRVDLYCKASGGYPAGAIHWFDKTNTNWTKSATLEITEGEDKLVQLSSKLTFSKIDLSWAPFRCVVLNNKFIKEGEGTFNLKEMFTGDGPGSSVTVTVVLMVTGIIVVAGLIGLLFRRRRIQQGRRPSAQPILRASAVRTTLDEDKDDDDDEHEDKEEQNGECYRTATSEPDT